MISNGTVAFVTTECVYTSELARAGAVRWTLIHIWKSKGNEKGNTVHLSRKGIDNLLDLTNQNKRKNWARETSHDLKGSTCNRYNARENMQPALTVPWSTNTAWCLYWVFNFSHLHNPAYWQLVGIHANTNSYTPALKSRRAVHILSYQARSRPHLQKKFWVIHIQCSQTITLRARDFSIFVDANHQINYHFIEIAESESDWINSANQIAVFALVY